METKKEKVVVVRSAEDLSLITKTLRLPKYVTDAIRAEGFRRSSESGKRISEQKIIEEAVIKFLNL